MSLKRKPPDFTGSQPSPRLTEVKPLPAVFSSEPLRYPENGAACEEALTLTGLNCAGYGSSVCVTGPFGLFAAGEVLRHLAANDSSA